METKTFSDKVIGILRDYCDNQHGGNIKAASRALGLDADKGILYKWLNGRNSPRLDIIGPVLDQIGVELSTPAQRRLNSAYKSEPEASDAKLKEMKARLEEALDKLAYWRQQAERMQGETDALERIVRMLTDRAQTGNGRKEVLPAGNEKKVAYMGADAFKD